MKSHKELVIRLLGLSTVLTSMGCALNIGTEPVVAGQAAVCIYQNGSKLSEDLAVDFDGEIIDFWYESGSLSGLGSCNGLAERVLQIESTDGTIWTLGYGIEDELGFSRTPDLEFETGVAIQVVLRQSTEWITSTGFAVSELGWPVLAIETGGSSPALLGTDVPGLDVNSGQLAGDKDTECGLQSSREINFSADRILPVVPFAESPITLYGESYMAMAIGNLSWDDDTSCTDLTAYFAWAFYYADL